MKLTPEGIFFSDNDIRRMAEQTIALLPMIFPEEFDVPEMLGETGVRTEVAEEVRDLLITRLKADLDLSRKLNSILWRINDR